MFSRRNFLGSGCAALGTSNAKAETNDINILQRAYENLHPGLLNYTAASEMDRRFIALKEQWAANETLSARYLALSKFLAGIRCGHTYANFYNQSSKVQQALFNQPGRVPYHFEWLQDEMVLLRDFSGQDLPRGTKIQKINGQTTHAILSALMFVARADGSNDGKRRSLMSVMGYEDYESFDVFYPLIFGNADSYDLTVELPNGRRRSLAVKPIDLATRRGQRPTVKGAEGWRFEVMGSAAVMKMDDWALYNSKFDWKAWIDDQFAIIEKQQLKGLVVDLRANEGGIDCGNEIIARFADVPISLAGTRRLVRYRSVPTDLVPYLDTWDKSFRDLGATAQPFDSRYYSLPRESNDEEIKPVGNASRAKLVVLVGPRNSSATFQFANLVRNNKLGLLVGEETGGNRRGINGGAFFFLRLPESGLEADLPLIGQYAEEPLPDEGIKPDIAVPLTRKSVVLGEDVALKRALELLA